MSRSGSGNLAGGGSAEGADCGGGLIPGAGAACFGSAGLSFFGSIGLTIGGVSFGRTSNGGAMGVFTSGDGTAGV